MYRDSLDAAWARSPPAERAQALGEAVLDVRRLHEPFLRSSLPAWLGDQLVNSLSHVRSAMWFRDCDNCTRSRDTRLQVADGMLG